MLILRCNRKLSGLVARLNSFFCDLTHLFLGMVKMFSFALRSLSKRDLQVKQVLVKTLIKAPDLQQERILSSGFFSLRKFSP